jgi:hypothetical protein
MDYLCFSVKKDHHHRNYIVKISIIFKIPCPHIFYECVKRKKQKHSNFNKMLSKIKRQCKIQLLWQELFLEIVFIEGLLNVVDTCYS